MTIIPLAPFQAVNERAKQRRATDAQKRLAFHVVSHELSAGISQAVAVQDAWRALREAGGNHSGGFAA